MGLEISRTCFKLDSHKRELSGQNGMLETDGRNNVPLRTTKTRDLAMTKTLRPQPSGPINQMAFLS